MTEDAVSELATDPTFGEFAEIFQKFNTMGTDDSLVVADQSDQNDNGNSNEKTLY